VLPPRVLIGAAPSQEGAVESEGDEAEDSGQCLGGRFRCGPEPRGSDVVRVQRLSSGSGRKWQGRARRPPGEHCMRFCPSSASRSGGVSLVVVGRLDEVAELLSTAVALLPHLE